MKLVIIGPIPSKKNSRIVLRSGLNFPNSKYQKWHKIASLNLAAQTIGMQTIESTQYVAINFFLPDRRRRDLSNMAESIMDLLVDCGILKDDCWTVVPRLFLEFVDIDKSNPRAEVEIVEV